jgi:hypothetical protein
MIGPACFMRKGVEFNPQHFSTAKAEKEDAAERCRQDAEGPARTPLEAADRQPEQAATREHEHGQDDASVGVSVHC